LHQAEKLKSVDRAVPRVIPQPSPTPKQVHQSSNVVPTSRPMGVLTSSGGPQQHNSSKVASSGNVLVSSSSPTPTPKPAYQTPPTPRAQSANALRSVKKEAVILNHDDYAFLENMAAGINDPVISEKLRSISSSQKQGDLLSELDYEFLMGLSKNVNNDQASLKLYTIAQKRKKDFY
jgi:hypothetical protein